MEDTLAEVQCESCGEEFETLATNYEKCIETEQPVLCPTCLERAMAEQDKMNVPKRRKFEYMEATEYDLDFLNVLGCEGWELIQILVNKAYFKRGVLK